MGMGGNGNVESHSHTSLVRDTIGQMRFLSPGGTGIRGLMKGMKTLPQGNQELLVVRDKVGRPPGQLGVSKSMECDIFPSVL